MLPFVCEITQKHNHNLVNLYIITSMQIPFNGNIGSDIGLCSTCMCIIPYPLYVSRQAVNLLLVQSEIFISETKSGWQLILDILPSNALAHVEYSYQLMSACLGF